RIILDSELRSALEGASADMVITPRAAAAFLVHALVDENGGTLQVSPPDAEVLLFGVAFKLR
ncbi:MAG: histidine phosphotransferase, partial [Sphingomonas sp.]|nr:histidine phosphotransferase [Sphingomonas sp.]